MVFTKIGFTGTQQGMTDIQEGRLRGYISGVMSDLCIDIKEFHHGDCIGSDTQAHYLVREHDPNILVFIHPPINKTKASNLAGDVVLKPKDYIARNHDIVDAVELLIATPNEEEEQLRSGTWATIRYARKQHKPILIIMPNGRAVIET